jgi:hypothetical protein
MPKCIGNFHDQFVRRYLENAETRFLNKQREVFILKKNGYMMQVYVYATVVPKIVFFKINHNPSFAKWKHNGDQ